MSGRRRNGLGRGLGALIGPPPTPVVTSRAPTPDSSPSVVESAEPNAPADGAALVGVPGVQFADLPVRLIRANPRQPRTVFDEDSLSELTHSVREFGVLQPIVVRPTNDGEYELVMGERRWRAAATAGLDAIPAIVRDTPDDALLRDALLENIHRVQLNPLEEAAAYQQLLQDFGVTHDELAGRLGRSRSHVSNTIRLLGLSLPVQRRVAAGVLSAGHARALLGLTSVDDQDELAGRIVAEGLSVRATEEIVAVAATRGGLVRPNQRRGSAKRLTAPAVTELAERLSDAFDTRVRVELGQRKGRIVIEFATLADLERLVGIIAPGVEAPPALTPPPVPDPKAEEPAGEFAAAGIAS
jgi:ParB family transcriptional regulator, chromosome partitioning protein